MNTRIFDAFDAREHQVTEYMAGCGMKFGMACTCGPECRCKNCPTHSGGSSQGSSQQHDGNPIPLGDPFNDVPIHVDQNMDFSFGMEPPSIPGAPPPVIGGNLAPAPSIFAQPIQLDGGSSRQRERNPSIISYGNGLRNMSLASDATFGRAMSGLSALSIDWENLEDFDLEVDHSAHINNNQGGTSSPSRDANGRRRSSLRRSFMSTGDKDGAHVSFKV